MFRMHIWILLTLISPSSSFLWTLFGNTGCNCCRCPQSFPRFPVHQMYSTPYNVVQTFQYNTPPPTLAPQFSSLPVQSYSFSQVYASNNQPVTTTISYRGPPGASPISTEQLQQDDRKYSTNQVEYHSDLRPVPAVDYGSNALSQLEEELAAEKYKYNLQKEKEKLRQNRIRVFKIRPIKQRVHTGTVEWQSSQIAKYTNEKAVDRFTEASTNDLSDDLEEFIPIEIGNEPELAAEEPAGPPPNVRNRINHPDGIHAIFDLLPKVCKKNGHSYKVGEEFDVGNLRYKCQEFGVYVIEGCRTHTGKPIELGKIEVIDHVKFHCLAHGTSVYYRETACGQAGEVDCDKVPLPRGYEQAVHNEHLETTEKPPEHLTHVDGKALPKGWILVHGGTKEADNSNDTLSTHILMYHPQLHHSKVKN